MTRILAALALAAATSTVAFAQSNDTVTQVTTDPMTCAMYVAADEEARMEAMKMATASLRNSPETDNATSGTSAPATTETEANTAGANDTDNALMSPQVAEKLLENCTANPEMMVTAAMKDAIASAN